MYDTQKACTLNDAFRTTFVGGQVVVTQGIRALPDIADVLRRVRDFADFNESNDPYKEHDFGAFMQGSQQVFWKLDYYNIGLEQGSPDPCDPTVTVRVLTVLLASEY